MQSSSPGAGLNAAMLQAVWENTADALALSDADGLVLAVNPAYCVLYGFSPDELVGHTFAVIFPERERPAAQTAYRGIFERGEPVVTEAAVQRADGAQRLVEASATFLDLNGRRAAMLSTIRDITDMRAHQVALERLHKTAEDALKARDEFLSIASHELRTPITNLQVLAGLALRRLDRGGTDATSARSTLQRIAEQSVKLGRLVNELLDVSRIESGRLHLEVTRVNLGRLVGDQVADVRQRERGHVFELLAPTELWVEADALRLEQVINNLLDNAVKYGGAERPIEVELTSEDGAARLSVRDHGPGVPREERPRLFDRFFQGQVTSDRGGLGLGLSVCKDIVELHGGTIHAEFPEDGGTRMVVWVPFVHTDAN